jgi:hypothetical protein
MCRSITFTSLRIDRFRSVGTVRAHYSGSPDIRPMVPNGGTPRSRGILDCSVRPAVLHWVSLFAPL